jgi:hypothetical protein
MKSRMRTKEKGQMSHVNNVWVKKQMNTQTNQPTNKQTK